MKKIGFWLCTVVLVASLNIQASAQIVSLHGSVSREALELPTYGDLPATQRLSLQIWFKPRHQAELKRLLAEQQDPASPLYHKWLTPKDYVQRFGVSKEQFDRFSQWLVSQGFQVTGGSPAQGFIQFNGSVLSINHAFDAHVMRFAADGSRWANVNDPQVPAEYGDLIAGISGLNNMHGSKAASHDAPHLAPPLAEPQSNLSRPGVGDSRQISSAAMNATVEPSPDITIGNQQAMGPNDFYTFYDETPLLSFGSRGVGCIAIVGDSNFRTAPVQSFNSQFGLNGTSISTIFADGTDPGINGDETETQLDLQWSHAVAPNASIKYFLGDPAHSTNGAIVDAIHAAVNDGSCGVISASFILCGNSQRFYQGVVDPIVTQAQAQGQTLLVASGDWGAAGLVYPGTGNSCVTGTSRNVNELASNAMVTSVGGTSFDKSVFNGANGTVTAHTTERAWDEPNDGKAGGATGGGASVFYPKPSFQSGATPNDNARDQPDVALIASPFFPGSFVYQDENGTPSLQIYGGTSIGTPMWAGIVDLLIQKSGGRVGAINPRIYQIASAGQSHAGFYDVTIGNNNFNGVKGYAAGAGYDQVTGWGTVDITRLVGAYTEVPAAIKLSRAGLNFGKVKIGRAKVKVLKLTNTARKKTGVSVTFDGGTISGSGDFVAATNCTGTVPPKGKCAVSVGFAPSGIGSEGASITIYSNASNSPLTFSVVGTGK